MYRYVHLHIVYTGDVYNDAQLKLTICTTIVLFFIFIRTYKKIKTHLKKANGNLTIYTFLKITVSHVMQLSIRCKHERFFIDLHAEDKCPPKNEMLFDHLLYNSHSAYKKVLKLKSFYTVKFSSPICRKNIFFKYIQLCVYFLYK